MSTTFFKKFRQAGLKNLSNFLEIRRVMFVNNLAIASFFVSTLVTALLLWEGLYPQFLITGIGALLFVTVIYLNAKEAFLAARVFFLLLSVGVLFTASLVAYYQGRFNDIESVLIGFMVVSYLLFDGKLRYLGYVGIYLILVLLRVIKQEFLQEPFDLDFYLTLQNTSILCLLLFLFVDTFRSSLMKAFVRLRDKDEILYSMIDNVPLFIALLDREKRYKMVNLNYEESFGMKREQIIGSNVNEVLPPSILEKHMPLIDAALNGESPEFLELTKMPDNSSFYAGGKYVPVRSKDGEIEGVAVFVNDVTKLEVAKNQLESANQTKDRLFSLVAHDIRGPLDLFEGLLNVSSEGDISQEDFIRHQQKVKEKLTDLRETVNTLLEWARTQLAGISASPSLVNVYRVVTTSVDLYADLIERKGIKMKIQIPEDLEIWFDENHFKISIRNMVHNALKFTAKEGEVIISAQTLDEKILMTISDTGVGMDSKKIDSILKQELQNSQSGTGGEMGTGLGLSLSLGLLQKNNCSVSINSRVGSGTEINIEIPHSPI